MNKRFRIVYQSLPHTVGGAEKFQARLITGLPSRQYQPIVVFPGPGPVKNYFSSLGIKTVIFRPHSEGFSESLAAWLREKKIDLAQSHHYFPMLALAAAAAGVPHIWRVGGAKDNVLERFSKKFRADYLHLMSALSVAVVTPSNYLKREFPPAIRRNIQTIYNGIEPALECVPSHHVKTIGMVGYFMPQKRHVDFIQAASQLIQKYPYLRFYLFGKAYPLAESRHYGRRLRQLIRKKGLDQFFSIQHTAYEEKLYARTDVIVLPSVGEGASNAILEAMKYGRPVIVSRSGGNAEFVRQGKTGYLYALGDRKQLIARLESLIRSPRKYRGMSRNAFVFARKFKIALSVKHFDHLYQSVLKFHSLKPGF